MIIAALVAQVAHAETCQGPLLNVGTRVKHMLDACVERDGASECHDTIAAMQSWCVRACLANCAHTDACLLSCNPLICNLNRMD